MAAEEALLNISISSSSGIRATSDRMPLRAIGSSSTIIHFIISIVNGLYIAFLSLLSGASNLSRTITPSVVARLIIPDHQFLSLPEREAWNFRK